MLWGDLTAWLLMDGRRMAKSPTENSLAYLRENGWTAEVVERWIPGANIRKDLWGFVDIVAIRGEKTLGVQTTSYSNVSARVRKIQESDMLPLVREAGWLIHVHGWAKGKKEGRRILWKHRIVDLS